ncbi:M20/M25/M40 family metallo-hydrolase [Candidatus Thorarchaeota archaeon]|nr:MAG: M20/M25/M40 family metallo-hydrolase [Candidatus Thorarchaeota archaeon]
MSEKVFSHIDDHIDDAIDDLAEFCSIPSVATKGENMLDAANLVKSWLESLGLETALHETSGWPVVTGEMDVGAKRTLLFYNHYDVQPAEPFDLWKSPPFELSRRNGRLYARGVADNKGDIVTRIWALKALIESDVEIPVNIKFVIEGEEEIGSPHLHEFVRKNEDFIKADGGIWEFGGSGIDDRQEAWLGLKGLLYVQLEVKKLKMDSHSANACVLPSAPYRLVWALNSLKNEDGKILIKGFYDDVNTLSNAELEIIRNIELYEDDVKEYYEIDQFVNGLEGHELQIEFYNGPTCNICGIGSGWQGEGSKTVLPAEAMVKVDFRLVESMDPNDILSKLQNHFDSEGFSDIEIAWHDGYPAAKTPVDHPFVEVVNTANKRVFGHDITIHPTNPGSGPLYLFKDHVPMVSIGCSDFYSRAHSPNETIKIENFSKSIKRIIVLIEEMTASFD